MDGNKFYLLCIDGVLNPATGTLVCLNGKWIFAPISGDSFELPEGDQAIEIKDPETAAQIMKVTGGVVKRTMGKFSEIIDIIKK